MLRNIILRIYCWYANHTAVTLDEPCGYCGVSQNPNNICITCFNNLK